MTNPLARSDPAVVINALLDKTRVGKIKWEPTPELDTFEARIGNHTYIRVTIIRSQQRSPMGDVEFHTMPTLSMIDEKGRVVWQVDSTQVQELRELHRQAQNRADRVEERLSLLMETLRRL